MRVTFNEHNEAICPGCGSDYMHQGRVSVFNRTKEDAHDGVKVVVDGLQVTTHPKLTGNPSLRRQGLTIQFECEQCHDDPVLTIVQHKGNTIIEWQK